MRLQQLRRPAQLIFVLTACIFSLVSCQEKPPGSHTEEAGAQPGPEGCTLFFNNYNTQAVNNGANKPEFTLKRDDPSELCRIETYHWNNGQGKQPGAIGLLNTTTGVQYGLFPAAGKPGQGGAPNVNWEHDLNPRIELKPGKYEVLDSDPASWSWNSTSLDRGTPPKPSGFAKVWLAQAR
jgi:hypothetical protein